jgi:hypothetical protein
MATYPVKHIETGETKDVIMSVHDWDQWKIDNPEWERYYTPYNSPGFGEVGDWQNKLIQNKPGWNQVLEKASQQPGARNLKI